MAVFFILRSGKSREYGGCPWTLATVKPASWMNPEGARSGVTGHSVENGIYFLDSGVRFKDSIQFFDFASRQKTPIFTLDRRQNGGLAISSDEKSLLFSQEKLSESYVVLVKNFR